MWMLRLAFYDLWCFLRTRTALFLLLFLGYIAVMFFSFYEMTDWLDSLEIHEENNHITSGVEMDFSNVPLSLDAKRELIQILERDWPEYTLYHAMGLPDGQQALVVGVNLPPEKYLNARYGFSAVWQARFSGQAGSSIVFLRYFPLFNKTETQSFSNFFS